MTHVSCISFPAGSFYIVIRKPYIQLCDDSVCAAALLSMFQYWHEVKLANSGQAKHYNEAAVKGGLEATQETGLWVYKSYEELSDDLLGVYAEKAIATAVVMLRAKGFIKSRTNPKYKWDRKPQYLFNTSAVQLAVDALPPKDLEHSAKRENGDSEKGVAIPEITKHRENTYVVQSELPALPDDSTPICDAGASPRHLDIEQDAETPNERETHELPTPNTVKEKLNGTEDDRETRKGSAAKNPRPPRSEAPPKAKTPKAAQPAQYGLVFAALLDTAFNPTFGSNGQMPQTGDSSPVPKSTKDRCGKVAKALLRDFPDAAADDVRAFAVDWLATHKNIDLPCGEDTFPDRFNRWRAWKTKSAVTSDRVPHPLHPIDSGVFCSAAEARAYLNEAAK